MSNCLFAYPDRLIPNAFVRPTLTGGAWASTLPLSNLQDRDLATPARTVNASASSSWFDFDLGTMRALRVINITRHNFSLDATVRVTLWWDSARTQLLWDSGALPVWLPFYPQGSLSWGHPALWNGKILEEDRNGYQFDFIRAFPAAQNARYGRVEIVDEGNAAGYLEMSRCILAPAWEPPVNMSYGNTVGWDSSANVTRTKGGKRYINEDAKWRVANVLLEHMTEGVAASCVMEMQRALGKSGELVFVYDPAAASQAQWLKSFLCTMEELNPIENPYYQANSAAFKLVEVL